MTDLFNLAYRQVAQKFGIQSKDVVAEVPHDSNMPNKCIHPFAKNWK